MGSFIATGQDGRLYEFTIQGSAPTPEELASINKKLGYAETAVPQSGGDMGSLEAGIRGGYADIATMAARTALGLGAPEAAQSILDYAQATRERTAREYRPTVTEFSQIGGVGDFLKYLGGVGGQSIGYMIPALGGAALAAPLAPYVGGPLVAGGIGATAVSAPTFFGSNIQEQMEQNKVSLGETAVLPAAGAAAAQSALNLVTPGQFGILARLGGLAGKEVLAPVAQEAVDRTWAQFVKELGPETAKAAITEAGTETLQEALAVFQANPDKIYDMDGETANRLANAAFGGLVLGAGFGIIGGGKTELQKLNDLEGRLEREMSPEAKRVNDARAAWWNMQNIDKGALIKDEEAAALEREADELVGAVTPKTPMTFDMLGQTPTEGIFGRFVKDFLRNDAIDMGPQPLYSRLYQPGLAKKGQRVGLTFEQKSAPLSEMADISTPNISYIMQAAEGVEEAASNIFKSADTSGKNPADVFNESFKQALVEMNPFADVPDTFIYQKAQDAIQAANDLKELLQKKEIEGATSATDEVYGLRAREGVLEDQVEEEGQESDPEFTGRVSDDVGAAAAKLTIERPKTTFSRAQLAESYNAARVMAAVLGAEAELRTAQAKNSEILGLPTPRRDIDPRWLTQAEKNRLKLNAQRIIKDPEATQDDKAEAEIVIDQVDRSRRKYKRRSKEQIAAERTLYENLYKIEDLVYAGRWAEAEALADTLDNVTVYSLDGKFWTDKPELLRDLRPKWYSDTVGQIRKLLSKPNARIRKPLPTVKAMTLPAWEFYKNSTKTKLDGTPMYKIGVPENDLVKETDEYWDKSEQEYFITGGVQPLFVNKMSGKRPELVERLDPAVFEEKARAAMLGKKQPLRKKVNEATGEEYTPTIKTFINEAPTLDDLAKDMDRKTMPEILADLNRRYVGFSGPRIIPLPKFDDMIESGDIEGITDVVTRRRFAAPDIVAKEKAVRRGPAITTRASIDEVLDKELAEAREAEAALETQARSALTEEEANNLKVIEAIRQENAGAVVQVDGRPKPYTPGPSTQRVLPAERAIEPGAGVAPSLARTRQVITDPTLLAKSKAKRSPSRLWGYNETAASVPDPEAVTPEGLTQETVVERVGETIPEVKQDEKKQEVRRRASTNQKRQKAEVIEGETFPADDPRWGEPNPASEPEPGPVKGPSTNSIIKPNLPESGFTTIYSTNRQAWTRNREAAEKFGGEITEVTLPNSVINQYGALSRKTGTLFFKVGKDEYMTPEQLGYESQSPVRTYTIEAEPSGAAAPRQERREKAEALPENITLYSVGGRRWHPDKNWVSRFGEVQEATIPTKLAKQYSRKVMYKGKTVWIFPEKGKNILDIEMMSRKPEPFKLVPEGKIAIEREGRDTVFAPTIKAANRLWNKMAKSDRDRAVFKDSSGNTYTINDIKKTLDAKSSGAAMPIPAGGIVIVGPDGKDFKSSNSVRGAHLILQGMSGKLRASVRLRDEAGNIYTPAQVQNFVDRIKAGEQPQKVEKPKTPEQLQAERDAETKILLDANNIRQAIVQISAGMRRAEAARLREEAQRERVANAPLRAAAEKTMKEMEAKRAAATKAFKDILERVGMKNVRVELVASLSTDQGAIAEGVYSGTPGHGLIKIAEDVWSPDMSLDDFVRQVTGVLAHELVHHMKQSNAFSKTEWATLVKHAKNTKAKVRDTELSMTWAQRASVLNRDVNLTKEGRPAQIATIEEEAVAEAFRDFVLNGVQKPPHIRGMFKRILGWIRGLFVYKSAAANQIFGDVMSGKYNDIAYNVQATGPQNANTFSVVNSLRQTRQERRAEEQRRKAFEEEQRRWREREAQVGGLTIEARGTSEGYRQGRGSLLREKRREAMDRVAEEARKASEEAAAMRAKYEGRRTWVSPKFSSTGIKAEYVGSESSSLTELAGAGPNATKKYYSFDISSSLPFIGELSGSVDESDPSVFYVLRSNFDPAELSAEETKSILQVIRKSLGPDIDTLRAVGEGRPEAWADKYQAASEKLMTRFDELVTALKNYAVKVENPDTKDAANEYANYLELAREDAARSISVTDFIFDQSTEEQIDTLEDISGADSRTSQAVTNLFQADESRTSIARMNTMQDVARKYSTFSINRARTNQVQAKMVHIAAANIVKAGLSKSGAGQEMTNALQRKADAFIQRMQDKLLPLGRIVDELRKKGITLPEEFDAYQVFGMMRGRTGDRLRVMQEQYITPMLDTIRTAIDFNKNDIDSLRRVAPAFADFVESASSVNKGMAEAYGLALHTPERNDVGAQRNVDENGNVAPVDLSAIGFTTQESLAAIRWFRAHPQFAGIQKAHRSMRNLVDYINAIRHYYHLSPDFNVVKPGKEFVAAGHPDGFKHYLPARGILYEDPDLNPFDRSDREIAESMRVGRGISTQYREDRSVMGRGSTVDPQTGQVVLNRPPPLVTEHLIQMGMQAIIRGEKNFVGHTIMRLLSTYGGETIDHYGRPVQLNKLFETLHSAPVERRLVNGVVKLVQDRNYKNEKDVFVTKVRQKDGTINEVVVKIHEPMLARALTGTNGYGSEDVSTILGYIAPFTRLLGELSTKWNPLFPLTNFPRDLGGALINLQEYEIDGLGMAVTKGVLPAARAMWRFQSEASLSRITTGVDKARQRFIGKDGTDWTSLIEQYQSLGGTFDLYATDTIADMQKEINELIAPDPSNLGKAKRVFKRIGDFIESYNKTTENAIRIATFKALLEKGISPQDAAWAAKKVTTNYDMGGTWKSNMTALYMFFNASVQGNMQIISAMARSPRVRGLVAAIIAAGITQDLMMSLLAGEDEETGENRYDQIPDFVLQNKMVFVDVTGASENGFLSIPMPFGYNSAHNFGRSLSRYLRGRYDVGETVSTMFGTFVDAFNPMGSSNSLLNFAAPTLTDPIVELYLNKDWSGRNIYKETNPFEPVVPLSQRHWNNTGWLSKEFTNFIHEVTGGTPMKEGLVEISPDAMDYLFRYYLGGVGAVIGQTASFFTSTIPRAVSGEEWETREIPVISKFVGNIGSRGNTEKFFRVIDEAKIAEKELKMATDSQDYDAIKDAMLRNKEMLQFAGIAKSLGASRSAIMSKIRQIENNTKIPDARKREITGPLRDKVKEIERKLIQQYNMRIRDAEVQ